MRNWLQRTTVMAIAILLLSVFINGSVFGQATGDYRSAVTTGNWNTLGSWERYNGATWVTPTGGQGTPTNANGVITIQANHTITVTAGVSVDQVTVASTGKVTVNNVTLTIANGTGTDFTVNGTLEVTGATGAITTTGTLVYNSGGSYIHNQNGGTIPTASWNAASTCNITGVTTTVPAVASFAILGGFGNFTWDCPGQTVDLSLVGNLVTVNGNLSITNTNTGSLRLSNGGVTATLNIGGNYSQTGGTFYIGGTTSSNTWTVNVTGNLSLSGGTLNMSGTSGSSTLNVNGNFSATAGTLTETGTATNTINFSSAGVQTYTSGSTVSNVINFNVNSGATLQMATPTTTVTGGGTFTLASGAILGVTSTVGITTSGATGNIQVTGTRTYTSGANYIYNGNTSQVAGDGLTQNTPADLTINNATSVTLSAITLITGNLLISQGTLDANNFNLTVNGNFTNNGTAFTGGTGTDTFDGTTQTIGGTASSSFGNLVFNNGSVTTMNNSNSAASLAITLTNLTTSLTLGASNPTLTVNGAVTINQATSNAITASLNINAATLTATGLVSYVGANTTTSRVQEIVLTSGTLNANGGITFAATNNTGRRIVISGAANINLKGALTLGGQQTLTAGTTSIFNYYDNTNAQTVNFFSSGSYSNLRINNTGGAGATLSAAITATNVSQALSVQSGTLNNGGFGITLASAKNFSVSNGATFNLTGTSTMVTVSGGGTKTFGATSTVSYTGGAQAVTVESYGNLALSGTAVNKTFAGSTTIVTSLALSGTAVALLPNGSTSSVPSLSFNGVGQLSGSWGGSTSAATRKSATWFGGTTTGIINVSTTSCTTGEWIGTTSTDWFTTTNWCSGAIPTASTDAVILSGAPNQPNINAAGAVVRNITISSGATLTITGSNGLAVSGDWTNNGTFTANTSTVTFTGSAAQIIAGSSTTAFNNITINKTASANTVTSQTTAFTANATATSNLTITQGNLILQATNADYTVTGNVAVSANGTLTHSVSWDVAGKLLGIGGNLSIDGAYNYSAVPRAHISMTGSGKSVYSGTSALSILTLATTGAITAAGTLTVNDNFWAMFGIAGGSFSTNGQAVTANAALLNSGGTVFVNGGSLTVSGGLLVGQAGANNGTLNISSGTVVTDGITLGDAAGTLANTITQTGGTLTVNGAVTINQPGAVSITNAWNINAQTATVSGLITFAGANTTVTRIGKIVITTGTLNANGGISFTGSAAATKVIDMSGGAGTLNLKGALTVPAVSSTLTAGTAGSIFNYADNTTAQTVNFFSAGAYHNLHINTTGGVGATLGAAISAANVTGNLRVQTGTLNNGGFAIVGNAAKIFEVANGAFFQLGGTTSAFPTIFGTNTLGATSTVDYRGSGAQTISAQNYGNLTTTLNGTRTITLANAGTIGIAGIFTPAAGTTSYANTSSTVSFNGTTGSQNIPAFAFNNLTVNNTAGVVLTGNVSVNGTTNALTFTNGKITTGSNTLTLASGVTVTTATSAKYVVGNLAWTIPTGTPTRIFDIGDATNYTPVTVVFTTAVTTGGTLTAKTIAGDHPNIASPASGFSPTRTVNRYWNLASSGILPATPGYTATFNFVGPTPGLGDIDAAATPSNFVIKRYTGSWNTTTVGTRTATSTQASAIAGYGDFQIGEICVAPTINTPAVTNVSCNGSSDGAIDITTTGGSTAFTYLWSNGATTEDISGLAAGNYSLTITASGGCTVGSGTISVTAPPVLNATVNSTNVTCNSATDGTITISSPTGGYGTYQYSINGGGSWEGSGSYTGLTDATYDVRIRDAAHTACVIILNGSLIITRPPALNATVNSTNITCNSATDGTITISSPTGGYGTYQYSINGGGSWQGSGSYTGLTDATYDVRIRDAAQTTCSVILNGSLTITRPPVLNATVNSTNLTSCISNNGSITISAPTGGYGTYEYSINGGGAWQPGGSFTALAAGTYDVRIRDAAQITCEVILNGALVVSAPGAVPPPTSGGDQTVCFDGDITQTITATATGGTITWYDDPTAGSLVSPPSQTNVGTVTYYAESTVSGCVSTSRTAVTLTINAAPLPPVSGGDETVCSNGDPLQTLIATATTPETLTWYDLASGGSVVTPAQIGVGTTTFYAEASNGICTSPSRTAVTLTISPILATPGVITGPTDVCPLVGSPTPSTYSIAPVAGATFYTWTVPAGTTIISGQGTTSLDVTFDNNFALTNQRFIVTAGSLTACTSDKSYLSVLKNLPGIPTEIFGPAEVCAYIDQPTNAVYSIDPVTYAASYNWVVPAGATIISGQGTLSIEVSYAGSFTGGTIKVTANSNCGNRAPRQLRISRVLPERPVAISGDIDACPYIGTITQVAYSIAPVPNAVSYFWTVPANVTLVSGQGTTSILVTFNTGYVTSSINVRSVANCGSSADRGLTVVASTYATPGIISGPTNACAFIGLPSAATYTIRKVTNASSYIWTMPAGATITSHPGGAGINDTIITVSYNSSFVSGTSISVQASGCVPSAARSLVILRVLPSTPGPIAGSTNVCPYMVSAANPAGIPVTYKVFRVENATSYNWSAPAGASITAHPNGAGVNDTIVEVIYTAGFVSGSLTVTSANDCGNSALRSLTVTRLKVGAPGAVTTVQTGSCPARVYTYSLPNMPSNATSVLWTVPAGGTILSGDGTISISVSYTSGAISGNLTATPYNNCSGGSTRILAINLTACSGPRPAGDPVTIKAVQPAVEKMEVKISPNPTVSDFKLQVITAGKETIKVRILDIQGRQLKTATVLPYETTGIGNDLKAGSYMIEVRQGRELKTMRVVKF